MENHAGMSLRSEERSERVRRTDRRAGRRRGRDQTGSAGSHANWSSLGKNAAEGGAKHARARKRSLCPRLGSTPAGEVAGARKRRRLEEEEDEEGR